MSIKRESLFLGKLKFNAMKKLEKAGEKIALKL